MVAVEIDVHIEELRFMDVFRVEVDGPVLPLAELDADTPEQVWLDPRLGALKILVSLQGLELALTLNESVRSLDLHGLFRILTVFTNKVLEVVLVYRKEAIVVLGYASEATHLAHLLLVLEVGHLWMHRLHVEVLVCIRVLEHRLRDRRSLLLLSLDVLVPCLEHCM